MKRNLLLAAFLLCCTLSIKAQNTFAPVGAEWWYSATLKDYEFFDELDKHWADQMVSLKDTVVAGRNCRQLFATRFEKSKFHPQTAYVTSYRDFYIYDNADTVFAYNSFSNSFNPLYIFNVQPGDTVCLKSPRVADSVSEFCVVIDSIVTELYDTSHLRSFYHHGVRGRNLGFGVAQHDPGIGYVNRGKYTEKIGGNWTRLGSFFPGECYHVTDYYKSLELPTGTFSCYHDANTAIKVSPLACDYVPNSTLSIGETNSNNDEPYIFPNPNSGRFAIKLPRAFAKERIVTVLDLSGQNVYEMIIAANQSEQQVNMPESLPAGIYVLRVGLADGRFLYRKLVVRR